jgi:hypothetical protein
MRGLFSCEDHIAGARARPASEDGWAVLETALAILLLALRCRPL